MMMETVKTFATVAPVEQPFIVNLCQEQTSDPIVKQLQSFKDLKDGWDFGGGEAIAPVAITKAIQLYNLVKVTYQFDTEVHPLSNGGVNVLFFVDDYFLDILIQPDTSMDLVEEKGIGATYEQLYEEEDVDNDLIIYWLLKKLHGSRSYPPYQKIQPRKETIFIRCFLHPWGRYFCI
jgi:hypothetical protein